MNYNLHDSPKKSVYISNYSQRAIAVFIPEECNL